MNIIAESLRELKEEKEILIPKKVYDRNSSNSWNDELKYKWQSSPEYFELDDELEKLKNEKFIAGQQFRAFFKLPETIKFIEDKVEAPTFQLISLRREDFEKWGVDSETLDRLMSIYNKLYSGLVEIQNLVKSFNDKIESKNNKLSKLADAYLELMRSEIQPQIVDEMHRRYEELEIKYKQKFLDRLNTPEYTTNIVSDDNDSYNYNI